MEFMALKTNYTNINNSFQVNKIQILIKSLLSNLLNIELINYFKIILKQKEKSKNKELGNS